MMIVYKTTNLKNNKIYIGKDMFNNPKYIGSGVILKKAIKKYGKDNFKKEIIQECSTKKELWESEIYWIEYYDSRNRKIGYNIAKGGQGQKAGTISLKETREKISKCQTLNGYIEKFGTELGTIKYNMNIINKSNGQKERFKDPNEKIKVSCIGEKNGMYGKKHTPESIELMRKKQTGKKHTPETIELYKILNKGENNGMYGKGYLISGSKNGRCKKWKIVSPDNIEYIIDGLKTFIEKNNLSLTIFSNFKNKTIPFDLKIRGKNKPDYQKKINSLGWSIYEIKDINKEIKKIIKQPIDQRKSVC